MQQNHDVVYFAMIVCLPLLVRLLMVPRIGEPVRAWSQRLGERLWTHLAEREDPDDAVLQRWARARLDDLERHLARVASLITDDDDMSATRQLGNRMAYDRLLVDVAAAAAVAPPRAPEVPAPIWHPTSQVRYLGSPAPAVSSAVEILEF